MQQIEIPTQCPCCSSKLELVNDQLFCRNQSCSAQLSKKLEHFCKTVGIKGLGSKTLELLDLADVVELYMLSEDQIAVAIGSKKVASKLFQEIDNSKQADLSTVLASFSIPLIGKTASEKICRVVNSCDEITLETCKQAGLGDKATQNLLTWIETEYSDIKEFLPFNFAVKAPSNASNITVCITGKLSSFKTKSEAHKALEQAGFKPVESLTKTTDYLVDEENKGSLKRQKAEQQGTKIITNLETFLKENT
jgi:NAD-dependent DNA ligase